MKICPAIFAVAVLILTEKSFSQGTFANLDFEAAKIILDQSSPYYPYAVNATNALPLWSPVASFSNPDVLYNTVSLGSPAVGIHDTNDPALPPIQGRYSVFLQGGFIGQTSQIASTARSMTFWAQFAAFQITFNSQALAYSGVGTGPNYTIYGVDISAYAGQTGELRFSGGGLLDNIQFSSQSIPEPNGLALLGVGAVLLGFLGRRNSSR